MFTKHFYVILLPNGLLCLHRHDINNSEGEKHNRRSNRALFIGYCFIIPVSRYLSTQMNYLFFLLPGPSIMSMGSIIGLSVAIAGLFIIVIGIAVMLTCIRRKSLEQAREMHRQRRFVPYTGFPYSVSGGMLDREPPPRYMSQVGGILIFIYRVYTCTAITVTTQYCLLMSKEVEVIESSWQ